MLLYSGFGHVVAKIVFVDSACGLVNKNDFSYSVPKPSYKIIPSQLLRADGDRGTPTRGNSSK